MGRGGTAGDMKPGYAILLALGLACLAGAARAAEWVKVPGTPQADECYYDRSKLTFDGDEIGYWRKVVFRVPQPTAKGRVASGLFRERIDCAKHSLKLVSYLLYAADGQVLEYVPDAKGEAAPIIPDSLGDAFEKTLCPMVRQRQEALRRKKREEAERERAERLKAEQAAQAAAAAACSAPPNCAPPVPAQNATSASPAAPAAPKAQAAPPVPSCGTPGPGPEKDLSAPPPCPTMVPSNAADKP